MATRQFLKIHYDVLSNPKYREFAMTPAHITYMFLARHVYRWTPGRVKHPQLYGLWKAGWLVCKVSILQLQKEWGGQRDHRSLRRDLERLESLSLIDSYVDPDGGATLYQLGSWGEWVHPSGKTTTIEVFYADRVYGPPDLLVPWASPEAE